MNMQSDPIREYYRRVVSQYEAARYYERYPLNHFWGGKNIQTMRSLISSADTKLDIIHSAQKTFMFSVNVNDTSKEYAVDWLLAEQRRRGIDLFSLHPDIHESLHSHPGNNVLRNERILTSDFLRTVNISLEIDEYVRQPQKTPESVGRGHGSTSGLSRPVNHFLRKGDGNLRVIELGAGLGHLARSLKLFGIAGRYVIIDIPETLVFSYCFLTQNFPDARVLLVSHDETNIENLAGYDFIFVPTLYADRVVQEEYDLFINCASMGEMRNTVTRYWMDFVQNKLNVHYLFTLNRYLNTLHPKLHEWRWNENECSVHYDKRWEILKWELEPSFTRSPYVDTLIARYVEIIAKRLEVVDEVANTTRSCSLVEQVRQQDWFRFADSYPSIMTMRDHIMVHDTTMTGTLFMLWEAMRLNPTAAAVSLLLQYMDTLLRRDDREFEEGKYYEDLFFSLYNPVQDNNLREFAEMLKTRRRKREIYSVKIELVESYRGYNLVKIGSRFIAVSQALGNVDLIEERLGERELAPLLLLGDSLTDVKTKLSKPQ